MPKKSDATPRGTTNGGVSAQAAKPSKAKSPSRSKKVTQPPETAAPATTYEQLQHEIAHLAYLFWLDRGQSDGHAVEDWLRAEAEVLSRRS